MTGKPPLAIAVDIGNSGLRVAKLNLGPGTKTLSDQVGSIARIDWQLSPSGSTTTSHATAENRYHPGDTAWTGRLGRLLDSLLTDPEGEQSEHPVHWYVSSVRRDAMDQLRSFLTLRPHDVCHTISRADVGLTLDVQFPERVGVDRLLAARAASAGCEHRPLIVIQAGSAVTVDWITEEGVFAGGAIVPGVPMMLRLLGQAADLLPEIDGRELIELPSLPGKNTEQAMMCGVSSALVGGVLHLIARHREQSSASVPIVLSGDDGPRLARHLPPPIVVVNHLVLVGLALVAREKSSSLPN